jgi:hypothetical protein
MVSQDISRGRVPSTGFFVLYFGYKDLEIMKGST